MRVHRHSSQLGRRYPSGLSGFTLIEIMVVMAIIAIIVAVGVPQMGRRLERDDLARAVHDTIEGCKTARDRAILQGMPWAFIIKPGGEMNVEAMPLERFGPPPEVLEGETPPPPTAGQDSAPYSGFPRKLGEDVKVEMIAVNFVDYMQQPEARVRFFPNGTSDEFTVVFNWNGKQRTVTVDIITGQATELVAR